WRIRPWSMYSSSGVCHRLSSAQKLAQHPHLEPGFLHECNMGALLEDSQLRPGHQAVIPGGLYRPRFVEAAASEERRDGNLSQTPGNVVVLVDATDDELVRSLHRAVDDRVQLGERS